MTRWSPEKADSGKYSNAGKKRAGYEAGPSILGRTRERCLLPQKLGPGTNHRNGPAAAARPLLSKGYGLTRSQLSPLFLLIVIFLLSREVFAGIS